MTLERDTNKVKLRLAANLDTPLNCAGFYLEQAISERIAYGYKILKVELLHDNEVHEMRIYQITHTL